MLDRVLDHKNVAMANIGWAILHIWIALEIEESMEFLAIVLVPRIRVEIRGEDWANHRVFSPAQSDGGDGVQWLRWT